MLGLGLSSAGPDYNTADVASQKAKEMIDVNVHLCYTVKQGWRHGNGRYGHGHTTFSTTMATNGFGHSTFSDNAV